MTISLQPFSISALAMATGFVITLHGDDQSRLRAAGEEAIQEIERLDRQLSFYSTSSDIYNINQNAAHQPVKLDPRLFHLLQHCAELSEKTDGAFDITVGPLMRAWGFVGGTGKLPDEEELKAAMAVTGMHHVILNEEDFTVRFDIEGVEIDLGAIGKGYAIERAADILRECGITSAIINGGTSTIYAIGGRPSAEYLASSGVSQHGDTEGTEKSVWECGSVGERDMSGINHQPSTINHSPWRIGIRNPVDEKSHLKVVELMDSALSVSAVHGKSFMDGDRELGHIIDPRTGSPAEGALLAAVTGPSPTDSDALSTALLVLGEAGIDLIKNNFPDYSRLVLLSSALKIVTD